MHVRTPEMWFQSAYVEKIETRSSLDEDNEKWQPVWERTASWSYEGDHKVEKALVTLGATISKTHGAGICV